MFFQFWEETYMQTTFFVHYIDCLSYVMRYHITRAMCPRRVSTSRILLQIANRRAVRGKRKKKVNWPSNKHIKYEHPETMSPMQILFYLKLS